MFALHTTMTWYGMTQDNIPAPHPAMGAQHSTAQHSTAQHSTAQHSTAQHSTAQRSTAQRSAAQHSTAKRSVRHCNRGQQYQLTAT